MTPKPCPKCGGPAIPAIAHPKGFWVCGDIGCNFMDVFSIEDWDALPRPSTESVSDSQPVDIDRLRELLVRFRCASDDDADGDEYMDARDELSIALRNAAPDLLDELERLREIRANEDRLRQFSSRIAGMLDLDTEEVDLSDAIQTLSELLTGRDKLREEVERRKKEAIDYLDTIKAIYDRLGITRDNVPGNEKVSESVKRFVDEILSERDSLRRENEELRKDSDRFTKFLEWVNDAVEYTGMYERGKREVERIRVMREPMK